jgi:tetratricopeptide (TPR) repeat protein
MIFLFSKSVTRSEEWFGQSSSAGGVASGNRSNTSSGIVGATEAFLEQNDPLMRGQLYYSQGELRNALQYYALAMRNRELDHIWAERARVWAELRLLDSATVAMQAALRLRRGPSDDVSRPVWESGAAWQFALGRILEDRRDTAGARAAYERSIGADPAYYPATIRLGVLAIQDGDTAGAAGALNRVVRRPDVQFFACAVSATLLNRIGRRDAAIAALRRGTEIEPLASAGWLMLARTLESARDTAGATSSYDRYLMLAPRNDAARPNAMQSLGRLRP